MYDVKVLKKLCQARDLAEITKIFDDFEKDNHKKMIIFKIRENLGDLRLSGDITDQMMYAGMRNINLYDEANKTPYKVNVSDNYLKSIEAKIEEYLNSDYLSIYAMPKNTESIFYLLYHLQKYCPDTFKKYQDELKRRQDLAVKKLEIMGKLVNEGYPCNYLLYYSIFTYEPYHLHKLQSRIGKEYIPVKRFIIRSGDTIGVDLAPSYDALRNIEHIYQVSKEELNEIVDFMMENNIPTSRSVLYELIDNRKERMAQYNSLKKEKSLFVE